MLFERKVHTTKEIATSSLPDIIFLLLVFFMVVTVLKEFDPPEIDMTYAEAIKELDNRRNTGFLWATKEGFAVFNDIPFPDIISEENSSSFRQVVHASIERNPNLVISLKADKETKMSLISNIHKNLKEINAIRISYSALQKEE